MSEDVRFFGYKHMTLEAVPRCFYVGKGTTRRPFSRSRSKKWHAVVAEYGLRVEVCIGPVSNRTAIEWEITHIAAEGTYSKCTALRNPDNIGCNFTLGGDGAVGCPRTEKQKAEISERFRRPKTPEHREKLRQANLGKKLSPERVEKTAKALRGRVFSSERRAKIWKNRSHEFSYAHKLNMGQPVTQYDPITEEPLLSFLSVGAAERALGITCVSRACRLGYLAGGYRWKYAKSAPRKKRVQNV
jgi:hypothetical protein